MRRARAVLASGIASSFPEHREVSATQAVGSQTNMGPSKRGLRTSSKPSGLPFTLVRL